jgi:DNA repair exonuclease SbcCD ATPase subunit
MNMQEQMQQMAERLIATTELRNQQHAQRNQAAEAATRARTAAFQQRAKDIKSHFDDLASNMKAFDKSQQTTFAEMQANWKALGENLDAATRQNQQAVAEMTQQTATFMADITAVHNQRATDIGGMADAWNLMFDALAGQAAPAPKAEEKQAAPPKKETKAPKAKK